MILEFHLLARLQMEKWSKLVSPMLYTQCCIHNDVLTWSECLDWTGGQIGNNDSADDMKVCKKRP